MVKTLTVGGSKNQRQKFIDNLCQQFKEKGQTVFFAKSCEHLDIDTPAKDSQQLFDAGVDFAMLITDRHHYIKSRVDLSRYLPIPPHTDWIVQEGQLYPADITLKVCNDTVTSDCGEIFAAHTLLPLMTWLDKK